LKVVELSRHWYRSHSLNFGPIHYGRNSRYRFDDPTGEYGVLYAAEDHCGAFVETFGQLMSSQSRLPRMISSGELSARVLSEIVCARPLRFADLTGPGLAQIGADARLCSGDHANSQPWSRALRAHPARIDGLYYPARHDPSRKAAAIFNEELAWTELSRDTWLSLGRLLQEVLHEYHFSLIESHLVPKAIKKGPCPQQTSFFQEH
jgi:RES domain